MTEEHNSEKQFGDLKRALQTFQQNRLNSTYLDLKAKPEYSQIGEFFFNRLYGPEDFSFRDAGIKKLHSVLSGSVYKGMASAVSMVIELHELSDSLDNRMVEKMIENRVGTDMNMEQYREIYRRLDNYDERIYQINLVTRVNRAFHRLSKMWVVGISLKTVRTAAHVMGMGKIMDFIYEGYSGFRKIGNIDEFVDTIKYRELAWHNEIWSLTADEPRMNANKREY